MNGSNVTININTSEKYYEYAMIVADEIYKIYAEIENISLDDLIKKIPPFKCEITSKNWFEAKKKEALKDLKIKDLKYILSVNCKKISGNKGVLIDRVWSIHNTCSIKHKTKKKRKKKKHIEIDLTSVEDSDEEYFNLKKLIDTSEYIFIMRNKVSNKKNKKYERRFVRDKNWIFKEYPDRYEYLGILDNNKLVKTPIPYEIENYLLTY